MNKLHQLAKIKNMHGKLKEPPLGYRWRMQSIWSKPVGTSLLLTGDYIFKYFLFN